MSSVCHHTIPTLNVIPILFSIYLYFPIRRQAYLRCLTDVRQFKAILLRVLSKRTPTLNRPWESPLQITLKNLQASSMCMDFIPSLTEGIMSFSKLSPM